jgi:WXXGXW repeat (2 copies)
MNRKLLALSFVLLATALTGCAGSGNHYVSYGPPPPRYGMASVAPGPGFVWAEGYWDLGGGRWAWRDGRWMRPPRPRAVWVAPHWTQEGRRWRLERGYWR